jgi:aminotransferase
VARELSYRSQHIAQSEIRAMSIECENANGINLAQGVCDTEIPLAVRRAAQKAIDEGPNSYTRFDGIAEIRQAISQKMREYNGNHRRSRKRDRRQRGFHRGLLLCMPGPLKPGRRGHPLRAVLRLPHQHPCSPSRAVPTYVTMKAPDWTFSLEDLEKAVTPRTKGIMVNTPANPSGKVFTREELEGIAAFAKKHDLFVFTDEIYEFFLFDGRKHISPGSLPGMAERTITMSGYSKTYSITGWRIGYTVSDAKWAQMIGYMNDLIYVCAPAPLQFGVAAGIRELKSDYYQALSNEYQAKRDKICGALQKAGLKPSIPQGAYYILADVSKLPGKTSKEKAMHLLEKTGVATVPGEAFYHTSGGDNLVRLCFAKTDQELDDACRRLERLKA